MENPVIWVEGMTSIYPHWYSISRVWGKFFVETPVRALEPAVILAALDPPLLYTNALQWIRKGKVAYRLAGRLQIIAEDSQLPIGVPFELGYADSRASWRMMIPEAGHSLTWWNRNHYLQGAGVPWFRDAFKLDSM